MKKESKEGITVKKEKDFSEWYTQIIKKGELADYSAVKGCMIIRPAGYSIWEHIQEYFNKRLKKLKVKNAYFPLFIPESFFKRELEHAKGLSLEVAWISNTQEGERLAIRPTSETVIYDSYKKWIRSYKDLPLKLNQWANVVRWETKATRLFLRTREFLWQEGHCVYETEKECNKETLLYLKEYKKLCEDLLAIPVITGKKTKKETFAGALYTLTIEAFMPDGKTLQCGTSHNLGQNFAKSFNISFIGRDEHNYRPWQNSWGFSTRLIGALSMLHGDNKGLVIPPKIALNKVVIVPIIFKKSQEAVLKKCKELKKKLSIYNPILDDRNDYSAGWKFNEWELKGIPIRLELGPQDLKKKHVVLVRRDNNNKIIVKHKDLKKVIKLTLEDIQKTLLVRARSFREKNTVKVKNMKEFNEAIKNKKLVLAEFCGSAKCEDEIQEITGGAKSSAIPFEQHKKINNKCVNCKQNSKYLAYFAKPY